MLDFPYKDCILEGGQTKDDQKRAEIFYNEILAPEQVTNLLAPKAFCNAKRYDENGEHKIDSISQNDNLIIKGNNLIALSSLLERYRGKVKCIYIDPPYNTGSDSFGYNDNFNHSTWLVFMKNRLELARKLLRDDGAIFVQCDDNEQAYLKVLMDEIFGRENFVCNFIWQKKTGASDAKNIAVITEYILCYAKTLVPNLFKFNMESYDINRYKYSDEHIESRGNYYIDNLDRGGLSYSDSLNYGITCPDGTITFPNGRTKYKNDGWIWKWGKEKVKWALENDFLEFRKSDTKESGWAVCYKNYLFVDNEGKTTERSAPYKNLILDVLNNDAARELKNLFDNKAFSYPKAEELIQKFIHYITNPSDIVLDFHLGSGTTAAVAHKMGRQYIGVEQMDYIQTIAVERLKKVIAGEQGGISKAQGWQGGGSFVYCELASLNASYVERISSCKAESEIISLIEEILQSDFVSSAVLPSKIDTNAADFKELSFDDKKKFALELLDKNLLYINEADMDDESVNHKTLEMSDKEFTRSFYGKGSTE